MAKYVDHETGKEHGKLCAQIKESHITTVLKINC
jgi:hypothetical protein